MPFFKLSLKRKKQKKRRKKKGKSRVWENDRKGGFNASYRANEFDTLLSRVKVPFEKQNR
jgi:hypothetical protein